jgi:hypothetical protein
LRVVEDESVAQGPRERKEKANICEVTPEDLEREGGVAAVLKLLTGGRNRQSQSKTTTAKPKSKFRSKNTTKGKSIRSHKSSSSRKP